MLSPSNTNTVWLASETFSAWVSVSNGALEVPLLPAGSLLLTYHTQPAMAIVTRPVSVPGVGPGPAVFWSESV